LIYYPHTHTHTHTHNSLNQLLSLSLSLSREKCILHIYVHTERQHTERQTNTQTHIKRSCKHAHLPISHTSSVKRDLLQCQKRPITVSKETYHWQVIRTYIGAIYAHKVTHIQKVVHIEFFFPPRLPPHPSPHHRRSLSPPKRSVRAFLRLC
jgi:hypothetical protein